MAWKPKEKQLTPEEAVELARRDLAPFWQGTKPLLAGVRGGDGKATAHPLDQSFDKKPWVFIFVDLACFAGEEAMIFAREWIQRYSVYEVKFLLLVRPSFSFMTGIKEIQSLLPKVMGPAWLVALDQGGLIAESFGVAGRALPVVKLLKERKILFEASGANWGHDAEKEIQGFLRFKDPGLPLAPTFRSPASTAKDLTSIEFSARSRSTLVTMSGKITQEADRIVIADPAARIAFESPGPKVSLLAQSLSKTGALGRVAVELGGENVFDAAYGEDLAYGEESGSEAKVSDPRLYHLVKALPAKSRQLCLRFPDAARTPVAIYGVRFSSV